MPCILRHFSREQCRNAVKGAASGLFVQHARNLNTPTHDQEVSRVMKNVKIMKAILIVLTLMSFALTAFAAEKNDRCCGPWQGYRLPHKEILSPARGNREI